MGINDLGPFYDAEGNDITDSVLNAAKEETNVSGLRKKFEEGIAESKDAKVAREAAEARAQVAERKLALAESGIDFSNPMAKYFADTYNGELTADAIKTAAATIGLIAQSADPEVIQEVASLNRIASASSATPPPTSLSEADEIARFNGSAQEFDSFMAKFGTNIDRSQGGAEWDSPATVPVTSPRGTRRG